MFMFLVISTASVVGTILGAFMFLLFDGSSIFEKIIRYVGVILFLAGIVAAIIADHIRILP